MTTCAALAASLVLLALFSPLAPEAQQVEKMYRIGHLMLLQREALTPFIEELEKGLRDLGYVEGRNIIIENRSAEGRPERLADVAAELVRLKVDVIVAGVNSGIAAAKQATSTIPIVMVYGGDPVGAGFIASLGRPGGNITGGSGDPTPEIYGKNLEFLKQAVPRASRVAFLWDPTVPGVAPYVQAAEDAARQLGVRLQSVQVRAPGDFEGAFASMLQERAAGILLHATPLIFRSRRHIADLAVRYRLPLVSPYTEFADAGGLMSYGPNLRDFWRRAAVYVDKILKGAKPADLPVEQPTKFELVINLKTAKALGLSMPRSLLMRADQVIE